MRPTRLQGLAIGLAAIGGLVVGLALMAYWAHPFGPVRIDRDITGVVSLVNDSGSAICVTDDAKGDQICSIPLQVPGSPIVKVGDHVSVTRAWIGGATDVLIVTAPVPGSP
jgi:hypothetical protein